MIDWLFVVQTDICANVEVSWRDVANFQAGNGIQHDFYELSILNAAA